MKQDTGSSCCVKPVLRDFVAGDPEDDEEEEEEKKKSDEDEEEEEDDGEEEEETWQVGGAHPLRRMKDEG